MNPRHIVVTVVQDYRLANCRAFVVIRESETRRESAFNQIPWHEIPPVLPTFKLLAE
jgi:hypothetical protein